MDMYIQIMTTKLKPYGKHKYPQKPLKGFNAEIYGSFSRYATKEMKRIGYVNLIRSNPDFTQLSTYQAGV